jgi:hypothetical protein
VKVIPIDDYVAMRRRELDGERGVFFPESAPQTTSASDLGEDLEAHPLLPPRVRRRAPEDVGA